MKITRLVRSILVLPGLGVLHPVGPRQYRNQVSTGQIGLLSAGGAASSIRRPLDGFLLPRSKE